MPSNQFLLLWLFAFICLLAFSLFRASAKADGRMQLAFHPRTILPLASGTGLICLALCTLATEAMKSPTAPVLDGLQHLKPQRADALARLSDDLSQSLAMEETPALWSALGMALALRAEAAPAADRPALADKASAALRSSVGLAPANPYVWARLAVVRDAAGAQGTELLPYLRMSWKTGPNEERLRLTRIGLALRHWQDIAPADRASVFEDIRNGWASSPETLLPLARSPVSANIIRAALVTDIGQLAAFEKAIAKTGR